MKWVIVGLGNPGGEYGGTRHNAGKMAVEYLASVNGFSSWRAKSAWDAQVSEGSLADRPVLLLLPETYMNVSGNAVRHAVKYPDDVAGLVVVQDDIDMALGKWKFTKGGGSGGHKGIESIMTVLATKEFIRLKIGVLPVDGEGNVLKPKGEDEVSRFVLEKFRPEEREVLEKLFPETALGIQTVIAEGLDVAMHVHHTKSA